jgi:hypothetical protein
VSNYNRACISWFFCSSILEAKFQLDWEATNRLVEFIQIFCLRYSKIKVIRRFCVASGEMMQSIEAEYNKTNDCTPVPTDEELHAQAIKYIQDSNQLIFQDLPKVISQIIKQGVWRTRNNAYKNFGEYALNQSPEGLGITNNDMLWLLKSVMNKKMEYAAQWAEVLWEVDTSVRTYAKEKKIRINDLSGNLADGNNPNLDLAQENVITYLPSRSSSNDGQLLKLKKKDPQAYDNVIQGKMGLKEAWPQISRIKLQPIESVKNKFSSLSKSDREAFLAWIEQEKERLL